MAGRIREEDIAAVREQGKATAEGLKELAKTWLKAGDQAREIFLLEKLRELVGIMVGTVSKVEIDQLQTEVKRLQAAPGPVPRTGARSSGGDAGRLEVREQGGDRRVPG